MKKGGRNKKENKKNKQFLIRLTEDEKNRLKELQQNSDYGNISSMILDIVLNGKYNIVATDEEMFQIRNQMLNQVKKIGNNFNQLLKHFNQKKKDNFTEDDVKKMLELMKSIQYLYVEINDNFKL